MFGDVDASTPPVVTANSGNIITTTTFTPPAGTVLVAHAWHDTAGGNTTNTSVVTDSTGGTLTWAVEATRNRADAGGQNGHIQISRAVVPPGGVGAITVTTTGANTAGSCGLYVTVQPGVDATTPIDVIAEGSNTAGAVSLALPASVTDNSRAFLMASDWNVAANMTAGAAQTALIAQGMGAGPDMRIFLGVRNALTTPVGTVETMSTASPTTGNTNNYIGYALRPAAAPSGPAPDGIAVPVTPGTPTAALGLTAAPSGVAASVTPGAPTTAIPAAAPAGLGVTVVLGTPSVALNLAAAPSGIAVPVTLGQPSVVAGTPTPDGIALTVTLGQPSVALSRSAAPAGIAVAVAAGQPGAAHARTAAPAGIPVPVSVGTPSAGAGRPVVVRPNTGLVVRPNTGVVVRPNTGLVVRP